MGGGCQPEMIKSIFQKDNDEMKHGKIDFKGEKFKNTEKKNVDRAKS